MAGMTMIRKIEAEVATLSPEEQLQLLERLVHRLRTRGKATRSRRNDWNSMYGIAGGCWQGADAQEYVNALREER